MRTAPLASPRERFAALVALPEPEIDVALGALLIAAEAKPELDVARPRAALGAIATRAASKLASLPDDGARARTLARFLHDEIGLRGNRDDYYDPRNSYLDEVLERGLGIPITLAIAYVDVARRLGLRAAGIGFPGHFLASVETAGGAQVLIDAFEGRALDLDDAQALLARAAGDGARLDPALLAPTPPREILARVLRNLKQIHVERDEIESALACSDRILLLRPTDTAERRDREVLATATRARRGYLH
jgi:regulator of sirC expression with transglutaminase-like and TPR domain